MTLNTVIMHQLLFLGSIGWGEILIIALIILLLFGGKKIPELMKGLGKGVRSFKEGVNEVEKEINQPVDLQEKEDTQKKDTQEKGEK